MHPYRLQLIGTVLLLYLGHVLFAQTQIDNWLTNDNYPYVWDMQLDYYFNPNQHARLTTDNFQETHHRLKIDPALLNRGAYLEDEEWQREFMMSVIQQGRVTVVDPYSAAPLTPTATLDLCSTLDTVVNCWGAIDEPGLFFIRTHYRWEGWRLSLRAAWHQTENRMVFQLRTLGPLFMKKNGVDAYSPFQLSVDPDVYNDLSINNAYWNWISQARVLSKFGDWTMLKGNSVQHFIDNVLYQDALVKNTFPIYHPTTAWRCDSLLSPSEMKDLTSTPDTLLANSLELDEGTAKPIVISSDIKYLSVYFRLFANFNAGHFAVEPLAMQPLVRFEFSDQQYFLRPLYSF